MQPALMGWGERIPFIPFLFYTPEFDFDLLTHVKLSLIQRDKIINTFWKLEGGLMLGLAAKT